jgi:Ca2+/Na+ antiporter
MERHKTTMIGSTEIPKTKVFLLFFVLFLIITTQKESSSSIKNKSINTFRKLLSIKETFLKSNESNHHNSSNLPIIKPKCDVIHQNYTERCHFVQKNEGCGIYTRLHYCYFSEIYLQPIYYIFMGIWVYHLFYLLGNTASMYFVPALTTISRALKLPANVAGVTLLALGNSASDLSSIMVAVSSGSTIFGIGVVVGVALFLLTVVLGIICLVSKVKVTRRPFLRDTILYFLSTSFILVLFLLNRIRIYESILLIVFYFLYIFIVVSGRFVRQQYIKIFYKKAKETDVVYENSVENNSWLNLDDWFGGWREVRDGIDEEEERKSLELTENARLVIPTDFVVTKTEEPLQIYEPKEEDPQESRQEVDEINPEEMTDDEKITFISHQFIGNHFKVPVEHVEEDDDLPERRNFVLRLCSQFGDLFHWKEKTFFWKIHFVLGLNFIQFISQWMDFGIF